MKRSPCLEEQIIDIIRAHEPRQGFRRRSRTRSSGPRSSEAARPDRVLAAFTHPAKSRVEPTQLTEYRAALSRQPRPASDRPKNGAGERHSEACQIPCGHRPSLTAILDRAAQPARSAPRDTKLARAYRLRPVAPLPCRQKPDLERGIGAAPQTNQLSPPPC